jgi:hypothetical protein
MRHARRLAVTFSCAAACVAVIGCSPDRQSGANKRAKPAAAKVDAASAPQRVPTTTPASYSEQSPASAAAISGLEIPDAKSMMITDESMTSSLSTPAVDPIAPHGQSLPQTPLMPAVAK